MICNYSYPKEVQSELDNLSLKMKDRSEFLVKKFEDHHSKSALKPSIKDYCQLKNSLYQDPIIVSYQQLYLSIINISMPVITIQKSDIELLNIDIEG